MFFLKLKKECWTFLSLVLLTIFFSCNENQKEVSFPVSVGERPESITKGFNSHYFVTVMNGKESEDGEVVELSPDGKKTFFKGADEPKGIIFLKDHLYFSDVTRVWKVDKDGKGEVFVDKADFPNEILYLNDVSVDFNNNGFYVTDMGERKDIWKAKNELWPLDSEEAKKVPSLGRVYFVDLQGKVSVAQDTSSLMKNPNGVGVDNNGNIMISDFFTGNFLVKRNNKLTPLNGVFRGGDAVEQDKNGDYYVSSWLTGKVWKIDGKTEASTILIEGLGAAADFYLEEEKGRLLLPDMKAGKVLAVDIQQ